MNGTQEGLKMTTKEKIELAMSQQRLSLEWLNMTVGGRFGAALAKQFS
jgi:hypothetical protein